MILSGFYEFETWTIPQIHHEAAQFAIRMDIPLVGTNISSSSKLLASQQRLGISELITAVWWLDRVSLLESRSVDDDKNIWEVNE